MFLWQFNNPEKVPYQSVQEISYEEQLFVSLVIPLSLQASMIYNAGIERTKWMVGGITK